MFHPLTNISSHPALSCHVLIFDNTPVQASHGTGNRTWQSRASSYEVSIVKPFYSFSDYHLCVQFCLREKVASPSIYRIVCFLPLYVDRYAYGRVDGRPPKIRSSAPYPLSSTVQIFKAPAQQMNRPSAGCLAGVWVQNLEHRKLKKFQTTNNSSTIKIKKFPLNNPNFLISPVIRVLYDTLFFLSRFWLIFQILDCVVVVVFRLRHTY